MAAISKVQAKWLLQNALNLIPELRQMPYSAPEFSRWKRNTEIAIEKIFTSEQRHIADFESAINPPRMYSGYFTYEEEQSLYIGNLDQAAPILQSMLDEIKNYWPDEDAMNVSPVPSISNGELGQASGKAFVAMWFSEEINDAYEDGIKVALLILGYEPVRIDEVLGIDDIMDEIFGQIKECDLMVADFTHGEYGPRGGVYYEAGYAEALGKPVIMTCRADQSPDIHFDTNHRYHIMWKNPRQLRESLIERISARLASE